MDRFDPKSGHASPTWQWCVLTRHTHTHSATHTPRRTLRDSATLEQLAFVAVCLRPKLAKLAPCQHAQAQAHRQATEEQATRGAESRRQAGQGLEASRSRLQQQSCHAGAGYNMLTECPSAVVTAYTTAGHAWTIFARSARTTPPSAGTPPRASSEPSPPPNAQDHARSHPRCLPARTRHGLVNSPTQALPTPPRYRSATPPVSSRRRR